MTDSENRTLILIPKDADYIEILGHRIDGFDSFETFCEHLKKYAELEEAVARLKAENERLQNEVAKEFTCFVGDPHKVEHCPYLEELKTAKAEAYKEFADRLKCFKFSGGLIDGWVVKVNIIDNLLKEMVGEDNGEI